MGQITPPITGNPVLVALDLSDRSERALNYGCEMATRFGVPMVVLHVAHETGETVGMYRRHNQARDTTPIREIAKSMLEDRIAAFREKCESLDRVCDLRLVVVDGVPDTRILEVANLYDASMILLCGQNRRPLFQLLNGSVAESVKRRASRPVVVIGENEILHSTLPAVPDQILEPHRRAVTPTAI